MRHLKVPIPLLVLFLVVPVALAHQSTFWQFEEAMVNDVDIDVPNQTAVFTIEATEVVEVVRCSWAGEPQLRGCANITTSHVCNFNGVFPKVDADDQKLIVERVSSCFIP